MRAIDKLRRMLDERGVAHSDSYFSTTWRGERGILHLADSMMTDGSLVVDMLTPEQAIAATLGGGTLTAEQVQEAIFGNSSYASYDGAKYYVDGIGMQAVADELNTRAERTCRNVAEPDDVNDRPFTCSECGARGPYGEGTYHLGRCVEVNGTTVFTDEWPVYKFCPNCGAEVVSE